MENLGFTAIPAITVICYLVAQVVKATELDNKWLPIICGAAGAVLGIAAMHDAGVARATRLRRLQSALCPVWHNRCTSDYEAIQPEITKAALIGGKLRHGVVGYGIIRLPARMIGCSSEWR